MDTNIVCVLNCLFFFFNDTATTEIYTLSLHDALPICMHFDILLYNSSNFHPKIAPAKARQAMVN